LTLPPNLSTSDASPESNRVSSTLDRLIFAGVIALIVFTAIPYGTVDAWSEALFECVVFTLTLLWIVDGLIEGSWRVGNLRLLWPLIALLCLAAIQSIYWWKTDLGGDQVWFAISSDPFESRIFAFRMAALVLVAMLVTRFASNTKRLSILVHAIIAVALGTALFGIARQAMQHESGFILSRLQVEQGFGQFINKNHFAFLAETALGLIIGIAFLRRGRRDRALLYLSPLLLLGAALILSRSRGGLVAVSAQSIFAALLFVNSQPRAPEDRVDKKRWTRWTRSLIVTMVAGCVLGVIIVAGIFWLDGDQLVTGVETATVEMAGGDSSEMHESARRRDIWRATWLMFKAHPIAGAGLGGFWAEVPVQHSASGVSTPQQVHNDYLELLASGGLLGAALFVWFAVVLVRQARQSIKATEGFQRAVRLGVIISLVGLAVHSMVDFGLHVTVNALGCAILLGILSTTGCQPVAAKLQA
jgi:O-antigen ligase